MLCKNCSFSYELLHNYIILFLLACINPVDCPLLHRVNKEYDAVFVDFLSVYGAPEELEWVQVYRGIARGLGNLDVDFSECVEDGNHTIVTFRAAFDAFENRKIFEGV